MPLSQLNLIVAGLWAIFFYHEIAAPRLICIFFFAMCVDILGAVLLNL